LPSLLFGGGGDITVENRCFIFSAQLSGTLYWSTILSSPFYNGHLPDVPMCLAFGSKKVFHQCETDTIKVKKFFVGFYVCNPGLDQNIGSNENIQNMFIGQESEVPAFKHDFSI
jgi:hypothetical protein